MRPFAQSDRHDPPGLVDEPIPSVAAVIDDGVVGREHAIRELVVAQELPDVLCRIELGTFGWQRYDGDVVRHDQAIR